MNNTIDYDKGVCVRIFMSDLVKEALEKQNGKTSVVLAIVPRPGLPFGATHAVYQHIRGRKGEEHPVVGHAVFYERSVIPAELQPDLSL